MEVGSMLRNILLVFIFILVFSPLAFGTVEQWSLTLMEVLSLGALLGLIATALRKKSRLYEVPGILPLILFGIYYVIQLIPLPAEVVRVISPETYRLYTGIIGQFQPVTWISLSLYKKATLYEFFRFAAYASFYVLTIQLLTQGQYLKKVVAAVIILSSSTALLAIFQYLFYNEKIFWFRELTAGGTPFGPFVNRNHYAGFMEMVFPVSLSIFLAYKPVVTYTSFREKVAEMFSQKRTNTYILTGLASTLMAVSVFLSLSRGGIISLSLSMIFFGLLVYFGKTGKKRGFLVIVIFLIIVLSVGWFGWDHVFERFSKVRDIQGNIEVNRQTIWKDTAAIIRDFPVTGTGFGTLVNIYGKYRTLEGESVLYHAHNDYLEVLSDGGLIAFLLSAWFLVSVFYKSFRKYLNRKDSYAIYLYIGSATGVISLLIHSLADFNLQIGSNGLYFFFLLGLMVSASHTRLHEGLERTYLKETSRRVAAPAGLLIAILFLSCLFISTGSLLSSLYYSTIRNVNPMKLSDRKDLIQLNGVARKISLFDPLDGGYRYVVANTEKLLSNPEAAMQMTKEAVILNPLHAEYLQALGQAYADAGNHELSERLLLSGLNLDRMTPMRYKMYASWLFSEGRTDEALRQIKTALSVSPERTGEYIIFMILKGITTDEMLIALPERVQAYILFADFLLLGGEDEEAGAIYSMALDFISLEKTVKPSYFYSVYKYYMKNDLQEDALQIMQMAIAYLPGNAELHLTTAYLYEELGLMHRAAEEYRRVLVINPRKLEARQRLDAIVTKGEMSR